MLSRRRNISRWQALRFFASLRMTGQGSFLAEVSPVIYYTRFCTLIGSMWIASTERGICHLSLPDVPAEAFFTWLNKTFSGDSFVESVQTNEHAIAELHAYLAGQLFSFSVPLDMYGTEFQRAVWRAVARIPYGETRAYADIAREVGRPNACRAVGAANGANPLPLLVPCHRVLGKDGSLTGYGGGLSLKAWLLNMEQEHCP